MVCKIIRYLFDVKGISGKPHSDNQLNQRLRLPVSLCCPVSGKTNPKPFASTKTYRATPPTAVDDNQ
jgi:hypothetical protein